MSAPSRAEFTRLGQSQRGLSVPATLRLDGSAQAPVVNVGVLDTRSEVARYWDWSPWAAAASWPASAPTPTNCGRPADWVWIAVEGEADLIGPDDPVPELDAEGVRRLHDQGCGRDCADERPSQRPWLSSAPRSVALADGATGSGASHAAGFPAASPGRRDPPAACPGFRKYMRQRSSQAEGGSRWRTSQTRWSSAPRLTARRPPACGRKACPGRSC
jgi:hypothetical protein